MAGYNGSPLMKTLVVYFSNSGNNKFLAEKIAAFLKCDSEPIKPWLNIFPFIMLFSILKMSLGIKTLKHPLQEYDRIVLCGPILMGKLISPLHAFINKYNRNIQTLFFATCCGSSDAKKDGKFGYAQVFLHVKRLLGDRCVHCEAFPIDLVLPDDQKDLGEAIMKTRLSDNNFTDDLQKRIEDFTKKVLQS